MRHNSYSQWPATGDIVLQSCETNCQFCDLETDDGHALRMHIRLRHGTDVSGRVIMLQRCEALQPEEFIRAQIIASERTSRAEVESDGAATGNAHGVEEGPSTLEQSNDFYVQPGHGEENTRVSDIDLAGTSTFAPAADSLNIAPMHIGPLAAAVESQSRVWPSEGELVIESWEQYCQYCTNNGAPKRYSRSYDLRRHVRAVHAHAGGDYPAVKVVVKGQTAFSQQPEAQVCSDQGADLPSAAVNQGNRVQGSEMALTNDPQPEQPTAVLDAAQTIDPHPSSQADPSAHEREWPSEGFLDIESWERCCQYCTGPKAAKLWPDAAALRLHVKTVHTRAEGDYPLVTVAKRPGGRKPHSDGVVRRQHKRPLQQPQPTPTIQLIISDSDEDILRDMHAQLHLRADVFDNFFLLIWRHIFSLNLSSLEEMTRTVHPRMESYPEDVARIIVTFLAEYGSRLWPSQTRSHLTETSRLAAAGYFTASGPVFETDGKTMLESTLAHWRVQHPNQEPSAEDVAGYSRLGQLLRLYVLAALHRSLYDSGYGRAVTADSKVCLHMILVADQEPVAMQPPRIKSAVHGSGPLAEALAKDVGRLWDSHAVIRDRTKTFLRMTAGLGGLPREELQTAQDEELFGQRVTTVVD